MGAGIPPVAEDLCRNNGDESADGGVAVGRRRTRPVREAFRRAAEQNSMIVKNISADEARCVYLK
jgi:hypothetical protein